METRQIADTDLEVSVVGMGCNNFSRTGTATETLEGSIAVIHAAIDAGITFFDGADIYGSAPGRSEEFMGAALAGRRDEVVLSTKFGNVDFEVYPDLDLGPKGAERYIRHAVDESLRRLRTDRIDLLQMHSPDPATPILETLQVLDDLVRQGKVHQIGSSNFSPAQIAEADRVAREHQLARFVTVQDEYSLLRRGAEAELLPTARELNLGFFPYFPLFNGLLTGKYTADSGTGRLRNLKPQVLESVDWNQLEAYQQICDRAGLTMVECSISWLAAQTPIVSVIAGATTPEQARANAAAARELPSELLGEISALFA